MHQSKMYSLIVCVFLLTFTSPTWSADNRLLQAGDVVYIGFPGEAAFNKNFAIDVNGKVDLPELGLFAIAGQTVEGALQKLRVLLKLMYLNGESISMELRQANVMVQVLGYVREPGTYTIAARGNIQTAIEAAGGLIPGAQLDRFQLQRQGENKVFSYKAYLDSGDTTFLPSLNTLDIVFVPASPLTGNVQIEFDAATLSSGGDAGDTESSYRIFGEVKSAGRYSLAPDMSIVDALMRAGGVTRFAGVEQIKVIVDNEPATFNLKQYLETGDDALLPSMRPNITVFVPIQEEEIKTGSNVVYVMGEVFNPGAFESKAGAGFLDILANAGGPTRFADSRQMRILHADGEVSRFDLVAFTEQGGNSGTMPVVVPGDAIFVPQQTETSESSWLKTPPDRAIHIIGQVYNPGRFEWSDEMSLMDLLSHAQGPTARADIAGIRILSKDEHDRILITVFNLDKFIRVGGAMSQVPILKSGDTVVVPELPQDPTDNKANWIRQAKEDSIYIFGQVGSPGRYRFNSDLNFLDILSAADGPTGSADVHQIKIVHRNGTGARQSEFNLAEYFQTGDEWLLPIVFPGDSIFIPEKTANWLDTPKERVVKVLGAVSQPGRYPFNDKMTVLDLLTIAGGTSEGAYLKRIIVLNNSSLETRSVSFNLLKFFKRPDKTELPVVRAGDTIFVPDARESGWHVAMNGVRDTLSVLSVVAIVGAL